MYVSVKKIESCLNPWLNAETSLNKSGLQIDKCMLETADDRISKNPTVPTLLKKLIMTYAKLKSNS